MKLDKTWHWHALKTSLGADYRAGYTYGLSDFQEKAIKELQIKKHEYSDYNVQYGITIAIELIENLKA
jgi:hypothetical protein